MATSLSQTEQIISQWQSWGTELCHAPKLSSEIEGGLTNQSYLLNSDIGNLVLRINHPQSQSLGINRLRESVILRFLDSSGIGPQIVYQQNQQQYLLYRHIEGKTWSDKELRDPDNRERIGRVIEQYQKIDIPLKPRNYSAYLEYYWNQLEQRQLIDTRLRHSWLDFLPKLTRPEFTNWQPCLSHHDLVAENIIETQDGLRIIDWEYAHMGHPDLDWLSATGMAKQANSPASELLFWMNRLWHLLA